MKNLIESLSPNERKILPFLEEKSVSNIAIKSNLDKISVVRSLEFLQNKEIVSLTPLKKKLVEIGVNGALYRKKGLPERRLLNLLNDKRILSLQEAQKLAKLSPDEFKASIGALKKKAMIDIKKGKIHLSSSKEEITKKSLEESLIDQLPLELEHLSPEQLHALDSLKNRKDIIQLNEKRAIEIKITNLGRKIMKTGIKTSNLIEAITPAMLKKQTNWKGKKFRRYDITSPVPAINGGKRHFVNQAVDYGRKIWTDMGFQEMSGNLIQSSFWNFDTLFTAQDHPVRELQDTFYINTKAKLPDNKKLVTAVKKAHELGIGGSKGWRYQWDEEDAKKPVLRTHTTCLSAQTLSKLKTKNLPAKFFAIGKCFRNETVDWSHGFEFNQTEGIVIDPDANFKNLLGYLQQFFKKMGFDEIRFTPAYFPYTEPSVEIHVWHPEKKIWLELGGAGMFRPEVVIPLLGKYIPILAWGPGFDRALMDFYQIKDLRELYKNNLTRLRKMKYWTKS